MDGLATPAAGTQGFHPGRASRLGGIPLGLALVIVAAPNLIFLATHLANPLLAVVCAGCGAATLFLVALDIGRGTSVPRLDGPLLALCLGAAFVLCLLGGEAHVFFANDDWLIRDAVLHDLVAQPWPVGYVQRGEAAFLRAPLGLYLAPALIGKLLGLGAAHLALLVQNATLFGCLFYVFARAFEPRSRSVWVLCVFVVFSGWDIVGFYKTGQPLTFGTHIEWWVPHLQFSSHVTQIFWVPNHAASGWVFAAAYLAWRGRVLTCPSLVAVFGLSAFWSPLAAIGALPFLVRTVWCDLRAGRIDAGAVAKVALAAVALFPVALYLSADGGRVEHGVAHLSVEFGLVYVMFLTLELGPVLMVLRVWPPVAWARLGRVELAVAVAVLMLVPLYRIGANDFVMRASIPALAILALCLAEATWPAAGSPRRNSVAAAIVALAVGAVTPLFEIGRAFQVPAFSASDCNLLTAARFPPNEGPMFHYLARTDLIGRRAWVLAMPSETSREDALRACWPDRVAP